MLYQNASGWNEKTNIERLFQKANTIAMNSEALAVLKQRKKNKKNKRARAQARKQPEKLQSDPFSPFSWTQPSPWPMAEDREQYTLAAPSLSDLIRPRPVEFIRLPNLAECAPQEFLRRAFLDEAGYDAGYPPIELEK